MAGKGMGRQEVYVVVKGLLQTCMVRYQGDKGGQGAEV